LDKSWLSVFLWCTHFNGLIRHVVWSSSRCSMRLSIWLLFMVYVNRTCGGRRVFCY
jgi:hypothetical protein